MLRLIATDMDGTLLNSQKQFDEEFFEVLKELLEKNIYFVVASGNQFIHLYNQFLPLSDQIYFISENGAYITKGKDKLYAYTLPINEAEHIYHLLSRYKELMMVICTQEKAYIPSLYREYKEEIERHYDSYEFIEDIGDIHEDILKFSIHDPLHHIEEYVEKIKENLHESLSILTSGNEWLDIQSRYVNKGIGLKFLQELFALDKEECAAFGDQMNDYALLESVNYSYVVEGAIDELKDIAYEVIGSNDEAAVTKKIKELIEVEE